MILSLELTIRAWWAHQWYTPGYHTNPLPESASCHQINHRWWDPVSVFPYLQLTLRGADSSTIPYSQHLHLHKKKHLSLGLRVAFIYSTANTAEVCSSLKTPVAQKELTAIIRTPPGHPVFFNYCLHFHIVSSSYVSGGQQGTWFFSN